MDRQMATKNIGITAMKPAAINATLRAANYPTARVRALILVLLV
jgi:hypothetical protein